MLQTINSYIEDIKSDKRIFPAEYAKGKRLYLNGACQVLSHSLEAYEVLVTTESDDDLEVKIRVDEDELFLSVNNKITQWNAYSIAALMQVEEELKNTEPKPRLEGKAYTREGMIKRVLDERREKAAKADYRIIYADNIYGEHILINEKGARYKITLRDFDGETGYINNPDWRTNKLGTTKHIIWAFQQLKSDTKRFNALSKQYPFVEIYLDPLNDYRITWHYPHELSKPIEDIIRKYFGEEKYIDDLAVKDFLLFIKDAEQLSHILIRPEVEEKVRKAWDQEMLAAVKKDTKLDFSSLKVSLFPYQQEGVEFATFREGAIIADEMGLGKTIQAIATAVMKKKLFGFRRTLIICPASLKDQWKQEIEKFSHEQAEVVNGFPQQRSEIYRDSHAYFLIVNYETVLRDLREINKMDTDFIILDEAQKIKNFSTVTAQSIKRLSRKHALVITGTPIENRLIDLYSIVQFIDPYFLSPLWEFSYQYCYFDEFNKNKITGYYNLQQLNDRLKAILIRREKRKVIKDLPNLTEITVPVNLHDEQRTLHAGFASGIASILRKKFISPYDQQKLMLFLANMRMVCNSTFLIDKETNYSPKLDELKEILIEKLDLKNNAKKVIIFSEWVTMLNLIGKMLHEIGIGYAQLSGKVAVKHRDRLVKKFESEPSCQVFLSTEAGGAGLNLQVADTVINFELPWNPAKKNQRIGRIDRLGQLSKHLTVINLVSRDSIEMSIASGLSLKQNLFEGVLNEDNDKDFVDFSAKGKAQFLEELENLMSEFLQTDTTEEAPEEPQEQVEGVQTSLFEDFASEEATVTDETEGSGPAGSSESVPEQTETMEKVMQSGMEFLSGLFKMATGKDMGVENQKIEIDKETGEVVMRFKMPKW